MSAPTVPVPAEVLDIIRPRVMACRCGRSPLGALAVTVQACRCGFVPLNDGDRVRCPRCKVVHGRLSTSAGEFPILRDRVVWSTEVRP